MTKDELKLLLQHYKRGKISEQEIVHALSVPAYEKLEFATIDHHRQLRQGFPEVILCQGKTPQQTAEIAARIAKHRLPLLATRATKEHFRAVKKKVPKAQYHETARTITAFEPAKPNTRIARSYRCAMAARIPKTHGIGIAERMGRRVIGGGRAAEGSVPL